MANASNAFDYLNGQGQDVIGQPRGLPVTGEKLMTCKLIDN